MDDLIQEMLEPERPEPGVVARRRRFVATSTIIGLAAIGVTSLTTNALFTNTDTDGQTGFVSGTIDITSDATDFAVDAGNAAPGDSHFAPLEITNSGTLQLRYAVELTGSEDSAAALLDELTYRVYSGVTPANCTAGTIAAGTVLGSAVLSNGTHWIGDVAAGEQAGDRTLASGASENLCVELEFDIDAGDDVQGATAALDFTFHAEQTANNP